MLEAARVVAPEVVPAAAAARAAAAVRVEARPVVRAALVAAAPAPVAAPHEPTVEPAYTSFYIFLYKYNSRTRYRVPCRGGLYKRITDGHDEHPDPERFLEDHTKNCPGRDPNLRHTTLPGYIPICKLGIQCLLLQMYRNRAQISFSKERQLFDLHNPRETSMAWTPNHTTKSYFRFTTIHSGLQL